MNNKPQGHQGYPVLKDRSRPHIERKIFHILIICFVALLNATLPHIFSAFLVLALGGTFIITDVLRLYITPLNIAIQKICRLVMREHERNKLSCCSWFVFGLMICYFTLPNQITTCTLIVLAWVDPIASLVGVKYGKHRLENDKSWEGFIAAIIAGIIVLLICCYWLKIWQPTFGLVEIVFIAILVALVELFTPYYLDDNLTIPVIVGTALYLLSS